jgi:hypothetical protein
MSGTNTNKHSQQILKPSIKWNICFICIVASNVLPVPGGPTNKTTPRDFAQLKYIFPAL